MGDEGRGTVWEEIIVNAPKDAGLVALSATVANVAEIADWIGLVHRPIEAITHPHRPVPLQYLVADLSGELHGYEGVRAGTVHLIGDEHDRGGNDRGRWYTRRVVDPTVMLDALDGRRLAARHLLHLQPRGLRARHGDGPGRGQAAAQPGAAPAGGRDHPRGGDGDTRPSRSRRSTRPSSRRSAWGWGCTTRASCPA